MAYRRFEPELKSVEKVREIVCKGHNVLQPMNVTIWAAEFVKSTLISECANDCSGVRHIRLLRMEQINGGLERQNDINTFRSSSIPTFVDSEKICAHSASTNVVPGSRSSSYSRKEFWSTTPDNMRR